jgi:hypothetical protein
MSCCALNVLKEADVNPAVATEYLTRVIVVERVPFEGEHDAALWRTRRYMMSAEEVSFSTEAQMIEVEFTSEPTFAIHREEFRDDV